jgi:hypothetical protein
MRANRRLSLDLAPSHGVLTSQTLCLLYPYPSRSADRSTSTAGQADASVDLCCGQPVVRQRVEPQHRWSRAGSRFVTNPSNISVGASGNDDGSKRADPACDEVASNHQRPGEISVTSSSSHDNGWHSCSRGLLPRGSLQPLSVTPTDNDLVFPVPASASSPSLSRIPPCKAGLPNRASEHPTKINVSS